jgi:hypothetical protein
MAALDSITLANDALTRIGESPIQSFSDNTAVSNQVAFVWASSRQWLLSDFSWSFAQIWAQLAQISYATVPPGQNYRYGYQLPAGLIRLNSIWYGGSNQPTSSVIGGAANPYTASIGTSTGVPQFNCVLDDWQLIGGGVVLANEPYLGCWYQIDQPDTLTWSPQFGEVMTAHVAWKLAFARAKSAELQTRCEQTYLRVLGVARHNDSIGRPSDIVGQRNYSNLLGIRHY